MSNELKGSLSLNTKKEKDTHPDYKGKITVDGKTYWLSGWSKTNDSGDWISLAAKLADGTSAKPVAVKAKAISNEPPFDDTIPF
jgi:hypothetical protein